MGALIRETADFWIVPCHVCGSHLIPRDGRWAFNGDHEKPSFWPSMVETCNPVNSVHYNPDLPTTICHFIIAGGQIQYCADCTHELAGQLLDLPT